MNSTQNQMAEMLREFKSRSQAKVVLESGLYMLVLLFLFFGNSLTLLVMLLNRQMRTIPNMFVTSLALSDLLTGILTAGPLSLPALVTSQWPFNNTACQFQGITVITLNVASIYTLCLMAVNRYYRIVKPSRYQRYFTKKKAMIMILSTWFYSICCGSLPFVLSGHKMVFYPSKFFCFYPIENSAFMAFGIPLYMGIPTCVTLYCYFRIFTTVRNHNRNFHLSGNPLSSVNVQDVKVVRTIFVIVVFYNLCWIPVVFVHFVDTIYERLAFPREVYVAKTFLLTISSNFNPVIYGVLNKSFRKNYVNVLRCTCCRAGAVVAPLPLRGRATVVAISGTIA